MCVCMPTRGASKAILAKPPTESGQRLVSKSREETAEASCDPLFMRGAAASQTKARLFLISSFLHFLLSLQFPLRDRQMGHANGTGLV